MNNQTLIEANNLSFKINGNKLFHNLSFSLNDGEALHISGENGSGKSTLIRIILGITKQTKGNVENHFSKDIAYLGHKNAIKNYLTLEDNLLLMGLQDHKGLKKFLEILNLNKYRDVIVANLSFGQQKKLALLRIFLNNSDLIVLDEPFVGLDTETQKILSQFLNNELDKNKSIIYTSHIPCEIESKILEIR
jgi:heme ABC exporter ATP-binding subunit CcmA